MKSSSKVGGAARSCLALVPSPRFAWLRHFGLRFRSFAGRSASALPPPLVRALSLTPSGRLARFASRLRARADAPSRYVRAPALHYTTLRYVLRALLRSLACY